MFLFPVSLEDARRERVRDMRISRARRQAPVDWDIAMPYRPYLNIKASTYKVPSLFEVEPTRSHSPHSDKPSQQQISPCGKWMYRERILPAGAALDTASGNKRGVVIFDDDVCIPMIFDEFRRSEPWMSFTPFEFFTLRPGTRLARGHTIVAGLGMGHQLVEVCRKRNVKRVTLIERDRGIVDWILPLLDLSGTPVDVVIGDACEILPKMEADVALIDIFPNYGGNYICRPDGCGWYNPSVDFPNIKRTWIWGAA